jgi:hypothetical protein
MKGFMGALAGRYKDGAEILGINRFFWSDENTGF